MLIMLLSLTRACRNFGEGTGHDASPVLKMGHGTTNSGQWLSVSVAQRAKGWHCFVQARLQNLFH